MLLEVAPEFLYKDSKPPRTDFWAFNAERQAVVPATIPPFSQLIELHR
jgi:hypothetical protein